MSWDYYSMGNTDIVFTMLDNISMMTGANSAYTTIVFVVAMIAFSVLLGGAMFKMSAGPVTSWFFGFVILWSGFFIPKVDMNIINTTNPTNVRVIQNMPLGLAFIGQVTSTFGKWFTDISEQVFTPIGAATYSDAGMVFGANAIFEARRANLAKMSPKLQADFNSFFSGCMQHDIALYNKYSGEDLLNSTDILTLMAKTNEALTTMAHNSSTGVRELMYCDIAYNHIKNNVAKVFGSANAGRTGYTIFARMDANAESEQKRDYPKIMKNVENTYQNIFNANRVGATKIIEQELLINAVRSAYIANMREVGAQDNVQAAVGSVNAEAALLAQQNTNWAVAYKYLPIAQNTIEAVLLSIFPIVIMIAILGGLAMFNTIMMYALTLLWIKLWPGLFAIVNGIALMYQSNATEAIRLDAGGMTWNNSYDVLSVANSTQAFAGAMCMLVPVLAWGLIKLAQGGLQAGFGMMAGAPQKAADASGSAAGVGNTSYGSSNINNITANQTSMVKTTQGFGSRTQENHSGGKITTTTAGVSGQSNMQQVESAKTAWTTAQQNERSIAAEVSQSQQTTQAKVAEYVSSKGEGFVGSVTKGTGLTAQDQAAFDQNKSVVKNWARDNNVKLDSTTADRLAFNLGVGANLQSGVSGNLGLGNTSSHNSSQSISQSALEKLQAQSGKAAKFSNAVTKTITDSDTFRNDVQSGDTYATAVRASQQTTDAATQKLSIAQKETANKQEAYEQTRANSSSVSVNQDAAVAQYLNDHPEYNNQNPAHVQALAQYVQKTMGINGDPGASQVPATVESTISNGKSAVNQLYQSGKSAVESANTNNTQGVLNAAGSLPNIDPKSGFEQKSTEVNKGINTAKEKVETGNYDVGQGISSAKSEVATVGQATNTQKVFNTDGSTFGHSNPNNPLDMTDRLRRGHEIKDQEVKEFLGPKGQGGESPQEPQPKRKLVAPRHQRRR